MGTQGDKIHIVLAGDSDYAQHATVAMTSALLCATKPERFVFYMLGDGLTAEIEDKMRLSVTKFGAALNFPSVDTQKLDKYQVNGTYNKTVYLRLDIAQLLPSDVKKAIYLDCDVVVMDDMAKLWDTEMGEYPLAAVPDYGIMASGKSWRDKEKNIGVKSGDLYFNSGVLVIDLDAWRRENYGERVGNLAARFAYRHPDQDALNKVFYRNWQPLPLRWNVIPPVWNLFLKVLLNRNYRRAALKARQNIGILHYAGGYKPWEYEEYPAFNAEYYHALQKTAFSGVTMPQPNPNKRGRSIRRQLLRIRLADFWQKFLS